MTSEKNTSTKKPKSPSHPSIPKLSIDEYLANAPNSKCDLVDGRYFHHSPASQKHVALRQFLVSIINTYVTEHNLGVVLSENFPLKLDALNWRDPDIMFIPKAQLSTIQDTIFTGKPDFLIEILSEDSHFRDHVRKRAEYETIGVMEYWILDPKSHKNSTFLLLKNKRYEELKFTGSKMVVSSIPGLFFLPEWLWPQANYPRLLTVLRALGLLESL